MSTEIHVIERALQIARSGKCTCTTDVRKALSREGYSAFDLMHVTPRLSAQIKRLCVEARAKAVLERQA